ncbi:LOW QUALITY PROTEIN: Hypothetical protein PHPALM_19669 [Phytophthora palmivora]|uniref:Uncharacterized protein n=1 Tax=Phytophthora palmivora TaxID=4796 RepID=A0A2P4XGS8_9STRA|nr:LOW QUALITY PROTEIN: Hypothetical protein PHPALM_19669 [Phytophthora palmivora]
MSQRREQWLWRAPPAPPEPVISRVRTGMVDETKETSPAVTRERGDSKTTGANRLKETHTEIKASQHLREKRLDNDKTRFARPDPPLTPPMNSSLFVSGLGRGTRMHIDLLGRSPHTPPTPKPHSPAAVRHYFGHQQPGYGTPTSNSHRLYAAELEAYPAVIATPEQGGQTGGVFQQQNPQLRYPDARQKKLAIKLFDGRELYVGFGSRFLEWWRRFERQGTLVQSACGFASPEDVKVDLLGDYLSGNAEKYYNEQVKAWWAQSPTLQYITFKTNITPAQAMKLFPASKDAKRTWPEHYMYLVAISEACDGGADYLVLTTIVQYASADRHTVLMQAEGLAHFVQAWELEPSRHKNLGRNMVSTRTGIKAADITLPVYEVSHESGEAWILVSGSSRHLVNDASWLEAVELCDDQCIQRNGEPLTIRMKGDFCVTACGVIQNRHTHQHIFREKRCTQFDILDRKGYALAYVGGRRVMAAKNGGLVTLDV